MGALKSVKLPADWSVKTVLPIAFEGRELSLEAHAFQGDGQEEQGDAESLRHERDSPNERGRPVVILTLQRRLGIL